MMGKSQPKWDVTGFADDTKAAFAFAEGEFGMKYSKVQETNGDPRDKGIVVTFKNERARLVIGWNEFELSLCVSIRLNDRSIPKEHRWVYFEPFVEFLTKGKVRPIVPQIYYSMKLNEIETAMEKRHKLFSAPWTKILAELAQRVKAYLKVALDAKAETLAAYHRWFESGEKQI